MFAYCRNEPVYRKDISGTEDVKAEDLDGNPSHDEEDIIGGGGSGGTGDGVQVGAPGGGNNPIGYGHATPQGTPGSTYTQISSDGKGDIVSQTTYNEYGQRGQRIDYSGRDHGVGLPHIHIFSYGYYNGELKRTNEIIERYFEDTN